MVVTAEEHNANRVIDMVVLEQLITWLPEGTVEWIQCYHPASLDEAIQLAEDHLVVFSGAGEHLALSFSLYLPCLPFFVLPSLPPFCAYFFSLADGCLQGYRCLQGAQAFP